MRIRGVIHICQRGEWKRSLNMLLSELRKSGLYDATEHIYFCIVTDGPADTSFVLPKSRCMYMGAPPVYERSTLLYTRSLAEADEEDVFYWYLHTKGIRWFGTERELNVIDWIQLLLYWNVTQWKTAVHALQQGYDTYGCNQTYDPVNHYSGNFWWATSRYLKRLPATIGSEYNDPEFWIMQSSPRWFCVFRSGLEGMGHYFNRYPLSRILT